MAIGVNAGFTQNDGLINGTLFTRMAIEKWYAQSVLANISTSEYEPDIKQAGTTISIPIGAEGTVKTYVKGMTLTADDLTNTNINFTLDKAIYEFIKMDKVDVATDKVGLLELAMLRATKQFAVKVDQDVLGTIYTQAHAANQGVAAGVRSGSINLGAAGAPVALTPANIVDTINRTTQVLCEQEAPPDSEMFIVLPSWAVTNLRLSPELRSALVSGLSVSAALSGEIPAMISGLTIYKSNQIASANDVAAGKVGWHIVAGWKRSTAFAGQVIETDEEVKFQDQFAVGRRKLFIYGSKVVKPEGLVHLYASQS